MNSWKFNVMIAAMVILAVCGAAVVWIYSADSQARREEVQPRDVLSGLTAQLAEVNTRLDTLAMTVNHSKELAAENKAIVDALRAEVKALKEHDQP